MAFAQFRRTKIYDLLSAAPLIIWYGLGVYGQVPNLRAESLTLRMTADNIRATLHVLALLSSFAFLGLLVVFLLLRKPPQARAYGIGPRAIAFAHAFIGAAYLWIPSAETSLSTDIVSWLLSFCGAAAAIYVAFWLGRAFSILPEARMLITRGPYAHIRHPLYLAESIGSLGAMMQYRQPWAGILFLAMLTLMVLRMNNEERVLASAFAKYNDYAKRTARLVPGLY